MKQLLGFLFYMLPFLSTSQGINFEEGLSWEQIRAKAGVENKLIFVDCYTTWCAPCKEMDRTVFSNVSVGKYMNQNFICVKLQMDSTTRDNATIKLLYSEANSFKNDYKVTVFPTHLFFASNETLLHKGLGFKSVEDFITLASDAKNPDKQFYNLVNNWKMGKIPIGELPSLANSIKNEYNDPKLAAQVAREYMLHYLDQLDETIFCNKDNLKFLGKYAKMITSKDRAFQLFYHQPGKVDSILDRYGYAKSIVKIVITEEEIIPAVENANMNGKTPNWKRIEKLIFKKFDKDIAYKSVLDAQVIWYLNKKQWDLYFKYLADQIAVFNINKIDDVVLNNISWKAFKFSSNKKVLRNALGWINLAITKAANPNDTLHMMHMIDTKACIFYKLGRKKDAISVEESIVAKFPNSLTYVQPRVAMMKRGDDIWLLLD